MSTSSSNISRRYPSRKAAQDAQTSLADTPIDEDSFEDPKDSSEDEMRAPRRRKRKNATRQRTSSRTNKFQKSMKEPNGDSIQDLIDNDTASTPDRTPATSAVASPRHPKSPAVSHSSRRRRVKLKEHLELDDEVLTDDEQEVDDDEEEEFEEEEEEEEGEEEGALKIQRIVASHSETLKNWKEICKTINTTEIDFGSRWYQVNTEEEDGDDEKLGTYEERFLVKWSDLSYMHCSWETEADLVEQIDGAKTYLTTFFRKSQNGYLFSAEERCDGDYFDPAFVQVDRILAVYLPEDMPSESTNADSVVDRYRIVFDKSDENFEQGTGRQFLIKWCNSSYSEATFEFERDLILNEVEYLEHVEAFEQRREKPSAREMDKIHKEGEAELRRLYMVFGDNSKLNEEEREKKVKAYQDELENHVFPNEGQLRDYQAEGVTWLMANCVNGRRSILADEMGLGKTIQTATFVNLVATQLKRRGPFLIIAPLSTVLHWYREFTSWTNLNTIIYHGSAEDRELIREYEIAFECDRPSNDSASSNNYLRRCMPKSRRKSERVWMAQVVITTPEMLVTSDFSQLTAVEWEMVTVDEAHRLKNHNSKLASNLRDPRFKFRHSLLLTGTPIQNNMNELWTLLNFIDPAGYDDLDMFLEKYGDMKSKEKIDELHASIRPYILRRLKEDVEKSVPPKEETLIEVELTVLQKQYYRALYEKNVQFLHRNKKKALDGPSISNLAMQLRKCCNHPFLLRGVEEEMRDQEAKSANQVSEGDFLVKASGKLVLLDKLLPRLKENGHRVLIFSQFKIMLDILEDYLAVRQMKSERIDGSITGRKRQMAIDRFQSPDAEGKEAPFVLLLSTRAGGVGINLTAADTCIIFDSDWNPQNDLQAQSRCHRIGQTKSVKVYRLLSRKTYEMQMFHMSSLKMGLDQAVLQGFESSGSSGEGAMTKEEVERLLRHGAYDIFNEEKAGTSEAESNDFVQQDIDSIMARRSKTVIHDNTGSNSNAAGGTFSKASFKAPKTTDGQAKEGQSEDIDIDDPEFWKKMVGEEHLEASFNDLAGKKRRRKQANYSEIDYHNRIEGEIAVSDAEPSSSDEYNLEDESSTDTEGSANRTEKKRKERASWGGKRTGEWDKVSAQRVGKGLQMYGYGNLMPWDEFCEKVQMKKKEEPKHDVKSVKQMCWSIVLFTLLQVAAEDAMVKRKKAEQKRDSDGSSQLNVRDGGVLVNRNAMEAEESMRKELESSFADVLKSNLSWLRQVFEDANSFAQTSRPRSREMLNQALQLYAGKKASTEPGDVSRKFAELWASLKIRGWTSKIETDREYSGTTRYYYGEKQYRTRQSVLGAVREAHPELKHVVEIIQSAESVATEKFAEEARAFGKLEPDSITADSLTCFLNMFAPLQLVVDRAGSNKLALSKKTLAVCRQLHIAKTIVSRETEIDGSKDVVDKIARLFSLDKRIAQPHPDWAAKHDAALVMAIAKHGWIEYEQCYQAIKDDDAIPWGPPFVKKDVEKSPTSVARCDAQRLRDTAARVADFFNLESDLIEELKAFNQTSMVTFYGLKRRTESGEDSEWVVDDVLLKQAMADTSLGCDSDDDIDARDLQELPPAKDLVRRAKILLARMPPTSNQISKSAPGPLSAYGFTVLDQTEKCNLFLAELLRTLVKSSFNRNAKVKNLCRKWMSNAQLEAACIRDALVASSSGNGEGDCNSASSTIIEKIIDHLKLVSAHMKTNAQASKNVLRAVLGMPILPPKNPRDRVFPPPRMSELDLVPTTNGNLTSIDALRATMKKSRKQKGHKETLPVGDRAMSHSMSRARIEMRGSHASFTPGGNADSLELTSTETLILNVVLSQGMPVWSDRWEDLLAPDEDLVPVSQIPGMAHVLTWDGMVAVLEASALHWHNAAVKKLDNGRKAFYEKFGREQEAKKRTANAQRAWREVENLEMEERFKRLTYAHAKNYALIPQQFAKKTVMLLEAVRERMGPVETKLGMNANLNKIKSLSKTENGLGPLVLSWLSDELVNWSKSLGIVNGNGKPLAMTAAGYAGEGAYKRDDSIGVTALLDKKACRSVFAQIAQQTRARSVFLKTEATELESVIAKASRRCAVIGDLWKRQPSWWDSPEESAAAAGRDLDLLEGLLEYGYSGFEEVLETRQSLGDHQSNVATSTLTSGAAQERANQLTRELHAMDDSCDNLRLARSFLDDTSTSAHGGVVQTGIDAFFKSSSKGAASKETSVIVLEEDSDVSDGEEARGPGKRTVENSHEVVVLDGDCSPTKKARVDERPVGHHEE